jgi:beta-1,2-mannobiose phosphorylase / 1,2-beta-oligomannan phosphorylase
MWLARSPDLQRWEQQDCMILSSTDLENDWVGAGALPIAVNEGRLEISHGSRSSRCQDQVGAHSAGVLLLDRNDPTPILDRSYGPSIQPSADFELQGSVPGVVFPTGLVDRRGDLQLPYGAADACIEAVEFSQVNCWKVSSANSHISA